MKTSDMRQKNPEFFRYAVHIRHTRIANLPFVAYERYRGDVAKYRHAKADAQVDELISALQPASTTTPIAKTLKALGRVVLHQDESIGYTALEAIKDYLMRSEEPTEGVRAGILILRNLTAIPHHYHPKSSIEKNILRAFNALDAVRLHHRSRAVRSFAFDAYDWCRTVSSRVHAWESHDIIPSYSY